LERCVQIRRGVIAREMEVVIIPMLDLDRSTSASSYIQSPGLVATWRI
jgi:hypothetical protein